MPPQAASPVVGRSIVSWGGLVSTMLRVYQLLSPRVDSLSYRLLRVTRCAQRLQVRFRIRAPGLTRADVVHLVCPSATHHALGEIGKVFGAYFAPRFAHRLASRGALFRVSRCVFLTSPARHRATRATGDRAGDKQAIRHMIYSSLNEILPTAHPLNLRLIRLSTLTLELNEKAQASQLELSRKAPSVVGKIGSYLVL